MAAAAGHLFVPAFQRESALGFMVEFFGKPVPGHVALLAIHLAACQLAVVKLGTVNVVMAGSASLLQASKQPWLIRFVTGRTGSHLVSARQGKPGGLMNKVCHAPGFMSMTGHTALFGVGCQTIHFPLMGILVATCALAMGHRHLEGGSALLLMASGTGCGQVGALQREVRFFVLSQTEAGGFVTIH